MSVRKILKGIGASAVVLSAMGGFAHAGPIAFDSAFVFLDNDGPNTVGIDSGENITVFVSGVDPILGPVITADQGATTLRLSSLFTRIRGSFSSAFAQDIPLTSGLTDSWSVTATNILGAPSPSVTATTNSLVGVPLLDRPTNVQINTPTDTGTLGPTVTWTNPTGDFNRNLIEIYSDTTDTRIRRVGCNGGVATCTSFEIEEGLLAPNGDYSIRVLAENRGVLNDFDTTTTRSNTFINHTATSTAREAGDVRTFDINGVDTGDTIVSGVNNLPERSVHIGQANGPGALTIDSSSSLTTTFVNVGRNSGTRGNLLVDGGSIHLDGSDQFSGSPGGGFLNVGRSGVGYADILNGATITMESDGFVSPGFQLGRNAGSFGNMNVSGAGTTIAIDGTGAPNTGAAGEIGFIRIGRSGDGLLNILDGAVVSNDPNGNTAIGESRGTVGGRGVVTVDGTGSVLNAGVRLNIGDRNGNGGQGLLAVQNGGVVTATEINVQEGGILTGNGTVVGNVRVFGGTDDRVGGVIAPGLSPGLLIIDGDLFFDGGTLLLEADSLTEIDKIQVTGDAVFSGGIIEVLLGFTPEPTDILQFFDIAGDIIFTPDFGGVEVFAVAGSGVPVDTPITVQIGQEEFVAGAQTASVPEPGPFALLALGLVGLGIMRRRKTLA